ncbi:hypothetical protein CH289_07825 [Rhodococcus sp. RS1C4]|nr:hypothetical protein [Rhodococcus sp. RS1C4]OZC55090.1 hypothetical protein CH289_07825 [Rhodococcus sp. RS1C4]
MSLADHVKPETEPAQKGSIEVSSAGATINNVVVNAPIANRDWTAVFDLFNLDGSLFEVVDDTVRMSTWQQSARSKDGSRDSIQLYAYSARFRRKTGEEIDPETVKQWRSALTRPRKEPKPATVGRGINATYANFPADPQLGKKGTEEAVENWKRGVTGHVAAIEKLISVGLAPAGIHTTFMGDETEGVCNNYANQPHTVELNLSQQLELDYDMRVWTLREYAKLNLPLSAASVVSNHGEWTRNGSKDPVTTRNDNASTHVARQVKKLFDEAEAFGGPHIDWTIGEGAPGVVVNLSGQDTYFSHGYVEKGKGGSTEIRTKSAIERQILGNTQQYGDVPLWIMAHYHHMYSNEFEGRTLFGCPALEAERSSEYMLEQFGVWSPPGLMGMLIGTHTARGWSDLSVL